MLRNNENSAGGHSGDGTRWGGVRRLFLSGEALSLALIVFILSTLWEVFSAQRENISRKVKEFCFITLEVRSSREEYAMILDWMGRQPQGKQARNISLMPISVRDEIMGAEGQQEEFTATDEFVPGFGIHYMKFRTTRLWITRSLDTSKRYRPSSRVDREDEILQLVFFSRNRDVVQEFMEEVRVSWNEQSRGTVRLYLPSDWGNKWEFLARRLQRPLSTLYLPRSTRTIVQEAKLFFQSKALYMSLGIPWRRGYLFEGAPGTGKTSFILALASELALPIYILSLQSKEFDDAALIGLINSVPPKSLLVIEDLETAIKTSPAANPSSSSSFFSSSPSQSSAVVSTEVGGGRNSGVSLSALLNAIDGITSSEGRLLIITVNDASRLPSPHALLRPGRIDRRVSFGPLDSGAMKEMVQSFHSELTDASLKKVFALWGQDDAPRALPITPAELQNELLTAIYTKGLSP